MVKPNPAAPSSKSKANSTPAKSTAVVSPKQRARVDKPGTPADVAVEATLKMPNERDLSVAMTPDAPDPVIKQAAVDVERGLQDTSKGAELDRTYKKLK